MAQADRVERFEIRNCYGGVLRLDRLPHLAHNLDGLLMPPVLHRTQAAPYQHGATWRATVLEPRDVILSLHGRACDREGFFALRQTVTNAINPHLGPFTLRAYLPGNMGVRELRNLMYDDGLATSVPSRDVESTLLRAAVRLIAFDPVWWSYADTTTTVAPGASTGIAFTFPLNQALGDETDFDGVNGILFGGGGGSVNVNFSITYLGTWPAYPVISILGPAEDPLLENLSTGEKLEFDGLTLAAAEVLTINTAFGYKTAVASVQGNVIGYLTSDSDLATFHLEIDPVVAGGVNNFNFQAANTTGDTRLSIRWYTRYLAL